MTKFRSKYVIYCFLALEFWVNSWPMTDSFCPLFPNLSSPSKSTAVAFQVPATKLSFLRFQNCSMRQSGVIKLGFLDYPLRLPACLVAAVIPPLSAGVKKRQKFFDSFLLLGWLCHSHDKQGCRSEIPHFPVQTWRKPAVSAFWFLDSSWSTAKLEMHRAVTQSWQHTVLTYPVEFLHKKRNNYREWKWAVLDSIAVLTSRGTGTPAEPLHAKKWSEMTKWLIWNWNRHCPQTPLTSQHVLQMSKSGPGDQHLGWWGGGERDRMSLAVARPRCFTVNGGRPRHVKVSGSVADGDENGVQIYFLSILGSSPHPHPPCHSLLLFTPHPHRDIFLQCFPSWNMFGN